MTENPILKEQVMNDDIEQEIKDQQEAALRKMADERARKYLKQHKREIDRLKQHAEDCLHTCNKAGYVYAIGKLRAITMQKPLDNDVLESLWLSSKQRYDELVVEAYEAVNKSAGNAIGETPETLTPVCSV